MDKKILIIALIALIIGGAALFVAFSNKSSSAPLQAQLTSLQKDLESVKSGLPPCGVVGRPMASSSG